MNPNNHPEDQASIEAMHQRYVSKLDALNDDLMNFQDDAYALGRSRGLKEGQQMRDELVKALESLILFTKPTKTNAVALNHAHQTIAKAKGGAA